MVDRLGQQFGNYRVTRLLGRGGFADVYLGEHQYLKTQVAIKVLQARVTGEDDLESFLKEARTIAHLVHPHIVRILDFGVTEETPFLVMDYAAHGTLRQRHPRGVPVSLDTILPFVKQIAAALQYAHDEKIIHRDVKPENMLLGKNDEVLLGDFGIAMAAQSSRYQSTQDVTGTVAYMSPEQIQGKPRPASDQYSLGVVIYEWLSGDRPFHGSFTELCTQHMFASPPPLREKVPMLTPAVEQVIMTALAKDPKQRFGSMRAFANALEQASHSHEPIAFAQNAVEAFIPTERVTPSPPSSQTPPQQTPPYQVPSSQTPPQQTPPYQVPSSQTPPQQTPYQSPVSQTPPLPPTQTTYQAPISQVPLPPPPPQTPYQGYNQQQARQIEIERERQVGAERRFSAEAQPMAVERQTPFPLPLQQQAPVPPKTSKPTGKRILIIASVCLFVILFIVGGIFSMRDYTASVASSAATAIAQTNLHTTATAQSSHATAIVQSHMNATATVVAANLDTYPPTQGTLAFYDPLSQPDTTWGNSSDSYGSCQFTQGAYYVDQTGGSSAFSKGCNTLSASGNDFSNFTIEVQMTLTKGSCGGMELRHNPSTGADYIYWVCENGHYYFDLFTSSTSNVKILASGSSPAIHAAYNQSNLIAVVLNGSSFDLYVNNQKIGSANDTNNTHGEIALLASNTQTPTEAVFSNMKIWTL